jgi:hypothetical protein
VVGSQDIKSGKRDVENRGKGSKKSGKGYSEDKNMADINPLLPPPFLRAFLACFDTFKPLSCIDTINRY